MIFKEGAALYATEIERHEGEDVLYINFLQAGFVPSIADNSDVMSRAVDALVENPNISRIVFVQQRNYDYPSDQVLILSEIARLYNFLMKNEELLSPGKLQIFGNIAEVHSDLVYLLTLLKQDPIACYVELKNRAIGLRRQLEKGQAFNKSALVNYIRLLERFQGLLEGTKLIKELIGVIGDYSFGGREIYQDIFRPNILPNFTFTRLVTQLPKDTLLIDQYEVEKENEKVNVTILKRKNDSKYFYHVIPPEYGLSDEHHLLLNLARNVLTEHRPKAEEFTDPERTREVFFNISKDLLQELARNKGIGLSNRELNELARILVRYTVGFGLIEILLSDEKLQDVVLNAPIGQNMIFVRHADYEECVTNIIPSYEDADSWAAKLRLQSGRPLDESNPVLDTDLLFKNGRARVSAITKPLSPSGLAFAFRRHRDEPWTLPLFIENKMINSFGAGLLSFFIDGSRTLLIAGTRSSGKTSLLGSLMLEIMPKFRTIVLEDSVTGDSRMIIKENGKYRKTTIGELIDESIKKNGFIDIDRVEKELNSEGIEIFSINNEGKVVLAKPSKFIRHKVKKSIYEVVTTSGRKIKVTGDHSLFGLDERKILKSVKAKDLHKGDFIAIPSLLPIDNSLHYVDLLDHTKRLSEIGLKIFVLGEGVDRYISQNRKGLFELAYSFRYKKSTIQNWVVKKILPLDIFDKIRDKIEKDGLLLKTEGGSKIIPSKIILDEEFLNFVGLWLADGCYDKKSVIISVEEEENKAIVKKIARRFNSEVKMHTDGFSSMINQTLFREIMESILELRGDSYTKKLPSWAYNLSDKQTGWLLKGFFSGDGCVSDKEVLISSCSKELIYDITSLLSRYEIILRVSLNEKLRTSPYGADNTITCRIGSVKMLERFREHIGFLIEHKCEKLKKLCSRVSTHDTSDVIPLSLELKEELSEIIGERFERTDYITRTLQNCSKFSKRTLKERNLAVSEATNFAKRFIQSSLKRQNNIGREHLTNLLDLVPLGITNPIDPLRKIVKADIFWDKVKSVGVVAEGDYVYDISVPEYENFICENIIAHNTLELPVDALRKIGYDILRMKVRSALLSGSTEVEASEGIRTSLRLGDSALIVGEVRSDEAKALYEAMRVGALANVVAGTIHGDSPYGVFDRVVNDLGVQPTSFKATDIIVVANPIKSADGLHSKKRVVLVTEVRKHWNKDPGLEKGFVDLLRYNVESDELEPTQELINGDSEVIKSIAGSVKGWAGNWDAVYDNIILRGKIKQEIVAAAKKFKNVEILESKFNAISNGVFHRISDEVREEKGLPIGDIVFERWKKWLYDEGRKF